ncbi:copper amine oxidase N-terminal domain-containing protein [Oscillospiraceae bacterium CM]|nr:copper amine oxidase N-terminal domain-containing protein [Oscillospiraceae bacterium CM]
MRRYIRGLIAGALCLVLLLPMSVAAAAAPIHLKLGTKTLNVVPVLMQDGRSFAPYNTLFKALGARAVYDAASKTITAVSGTTTVVMPCSSGNITITDGEETYDMYCAYPPIENTSTGKIYISIRYAAQALGYTVSWDGAARTIVLGTVDELMARSGATYTVLDKYLAYNRSFLEKSHTLEGTFDYSMDMQSSLYGNLEDEDQPAVPSALTATGTVSGLFDKGGEEMSLNLKTNLSDFTEMLESAEPLDDETRALLSQLDNIDMSIIINNETGMMYIKSPLLSSVYGISADAWVSNETGNAGTNFGLDVLSMSGYSGLSMSDIAAAGGSFRDGVKHLLVSQLRSGNDNIESVLNNINQLFSDQAMVRDGDSYVVSLSETETEGDEYGYTNRFTLKMVYSFSGETFTGLSLSLTDDATYRYGDAYAETYKTEMLFAYTTDGHGSLVLKDAVNDVTRQALNISFTYADTTQTPAREPAAGSTVISADDLYAPDEQGIPQETT